MISSKITLRNLFAKYNKIIIPDIQRDYVMGSMGKKIENLLNEISEYCSCNKKFYFSCITGYVDENNHFFVYDGQQRLVTLVYLCAYKYNQQKRKNHNDDVQITSLLEKFCFRCRDTSKEYLDKLLYSEENDKIQINDCTTFSIDKLINKFSNKFEDEIQLNYIMNNIYFELAIVEKQTDVEQFFMDLNDGLQLNEYEIFKAELNHRASILLKEKFLNFGLDLDNKWLNFFYRIKKNFKDRIKICEEELEIKFIQFCLRMMYIEENGNDNGYDINEVEWINVNHINRLQSIVDKVVKVKFNDENRVQFLNYSHGIKFNNEYDKVNGSCWNLCNNNYNMMLKEFIINIGNNKEIDNDILIWCYISNMSIDNKKLMKYLRFIKKLLNNNRIEKREAYFDKLSGLFFSKYTTFGIASYYKTFGQGNSDYRLVDNNNEEKLKYNYSILSINKYFYQNGEYIITELLNLPLYYKLKNILIKEEKKKRNNNELEITKIENLPYFNGLVNNLLDENYKLIVSYEELINKINLEKEDYQSNRNCINLIYKELANIIKSFDDIYITGIKVIWEAYNKKDCSVDNVSIIPQCLYDLLTDEKYKKVLQTWILGKYTKISDYNDIQFYLRYYDKLPKGWKDGNYQLCFPGQHRQWNWKKGGYKYLGLKTSRAIKDKEIFEQYVSIKSKYGN